MYEQFSKSLPEHVLETIKELPCFYAENSKLPAECEAVIPDMALSSVEYLLRFRSVATLQILRTIERSPIMDSVADWINAHNKDVALLDNACSDQETWRQMWTWMLAPIDTSKDTCVHDVHDAMTKRLDAFMGFTAVEDLQLKTANEQTENGNEDAPKPQTHDNAEDGATGQKQSAAPAPPKNKVKTVTAEAPVPVPMWLSMFDIQRPQADGSVKTIPMRCLSRHQEQWR